jgi:hypothetical protein
MLKMLCYNVMKKLKIGASTEEIVTNAQNISWDALP